MAFDTFFQDLRIGLRVLRKEKSFCFLAVSVLAIGICAVTTQYAVVNGALLRGFSFPGADRLVSVELIDPTTFTPTNYRSRVVTPDFMELKAQAQSFEGMTGYLGNTTVNLTYQDQPRRLMGGYVPWDFFRTLGAAPALGRDFVPEDDVANVNLAVMLSDAFWRSDFGADPNAIGRSVRINGRPGTIIGVMPKSFAFPSYEHIWIPFNVEYPVRARGDGVANSTITLVARLKPGVSIDQAEAEVTRFARHLAEVYPDTNRQYTVGYVRPLIALFTGPQLPKLLFTMLAFCAGVLLIACVNVMNMQFARATLRSKELAIRSALGATRWRLIRQMLTESLLIAILGAVIGVAGAYYVTDYLNFAKANLTNPLPHWMVFTLDFKVLAFVVLVTLLAALVAGFVPAWMASRASTAQVLKESGRGNTGRTVGLISRGLVVFQITVTSILLIGAMLQLQSIHGQQTLDHGYDIRSILSARLGLMQTDYPTLAAKRTFYERLLRELRATPEFASAAITSRNRMSLASSTRIEIEGRQYMSDSERPTAIIENISSGYFEVLGLRLREGRDFSELDQDERDPVAIVNAAFAQKHFGSESPLGRRFRTVQGARDSFGPWRTIVGVVGDLRMQGPLDRESDGTGFFTPFATTAANFSTIVIRPREGQRPQGLAATLQAATSRVDPNLPLYYFLTPEEAIAGFLTQNRFIAVMFGAFGVVAVILASIGLYGIMSFSVNQRLQEFGIRMALGADRNRILGLVFRQGTTQVVSGLALGLGCALLATFFAADLLQNALFNVSPRDPLTYLGVAGLLVGVSALAMLVPARRATRVDPMVALRSE